MKSPIGESLLSEIGSLGGGKYGFPTLRWFALNGHH